MNEPIVQEPLAFIDLQKQRARLDGHIDRAIQRVLSHGQFIMGPEVGELEAALGFANRVGARVVTRFGATAALPRRAELEETR